MFPPVSNSFTEFVLYCFFSYEKGFKRMIGGSKNFSINPITWFVDEGTRKIIAT